MWVAHTHGSILPSVLAGLRLLLVLCLWLSISTVALTWKRRSRSTAKILPISKATSKRKVKAIGPVPDEALVDLGFVRADGLHTPTRG